jgi:hypothetical protein
MIKTIIDRMNRKSKLYASILGITLFFVSSIFTSFGISLVVVVFSGIAISIVDHFKKGGIMVYDQRWRPTLYFAFVMTPLAAFLITLLFE